MHTSTQNMSMATTSTNIHTAVAMVIHAKMILRWI